MAIEIIEIAVAMAFITPARMTKAPEVTPKNPTMTPIMTPITTPKMCPPLTLLQPSVNGDDCDG